MITSQTAFEVVGGLACGLCGNRAFRIYRVARGLRLLIYCDSDACGAEIGQALNWSYGEGKLKPTGL